MVVHLEANHFDLDKYYQGVQALHWIRQDTDADTRIAVIDRALVPVGWRTFIRHGQLALPRFSNGWRRRQMGAL
jgi:hypothetical protein